MSTSTPFLPSFDDHLNNDLQLIPDGFVYLRARPDVCWQRMQRR